MKKTKHRRMWLPLLVSIIIMIASLLLLKKGIFPYSQVFFALSAAISCGVFGMKLGEIGQWAAMRKEPEVSRLAEIEEKDERNVAIGNMAKGKAFEFMSFLYSALFLAFILLGTELQTLLIFVTAYLLIHGVYIYHLVRLRRVM